MKTISIVSPCYNEEGNVRDLHQRTAAVMRQINGYDYEHIFIDNASTDSTVSILKSIASTDPRVKVIVNARNFGGPRSTHHGMLAATGDAVILLLSDLQDPPELIKTFVSEWENGHKVVAAVKANSDESRIAFFLRTLCYDTLQKISEVRLLRRFHGFGLYDRQVMDVLRTIDDPVPYFRGLIAELGIDVVEVSYHQSARKAGKTKVSFYHLYDLAMLGMVSHSKVPLRIATFFGMLIAFLSGIVGTGYFIAKLLNWYSFPLGVAPLVVGLFFFSSVQLFFVGLLGEYIGSIHAQVRKRPLVVEKERINFNAPPEMSRNHKEEVPNVAAKVE